MIRTLGTPHCVWFFLTICAGNLISYNQSSTSKPPPALSKSIVVMGTSSSETSMSISPTLVLETLITSLNATVVAPTKSSANAASSTGIEKITPTPSATGTATFNVNKTRSTQSAGINTTVDKPNTISSYTSMTSTIKASPTTSTKDIKSHVSIETAAASNNKTQSTPSINTSVVKQSTSISIKPDPTSSTITMMSSKVPSTLPPKASPTYCTVDNNICNNGGVCVNGTENNEKKAVCVCTGKFYGQKCETEGVSYIYKQLTYALGGTTAFALIVIIILVWHRRKNQRFESGLDYPIKELDEFIVTNKRAGMPANNVVNVASYDHDIEY